ncbi:JmjC domain-containing protein [Alcanivorax sp. 1008]|uniref:JmjC domain-containing protein n=1 Tax=Alcanivorax sp. 1008 TaxID=2816853 RepID=UPI001E584D38
MDRADVNLPSFELPLPAEQFLQQYWQKKPLLMRAAASGLAHPDPDTLAGLALEDCVESRLMTGAGGGPWNVQSGPFTEQDFSALPKQNWTLLVQSVDHFMTEVSLLLDSFSFLPGWRMEDIMLSYAVKGGSVGPHYDRYDVFLIQARGKRHWQLGPHCDDNSPRLPHDELRLLDGMPVEDEFVVEPGDVLYLPPGVGHWGVAEDDDCITWSVGFRAPAPADLLARLADEAIERSDQSLFTDVGRAPCSAPELLGDADLANLRQQALELIDRDVLREALSALLSEPRQPAGLDFEVDCGHIAAASEDTVMVRHGAARLLIDTLGNAWINGEKRPLGEAQRPLATLLARQRSYTETELQPLLNDDSEQLMEEWIDAGYFTVIE